MSRRDESQERSRQESHRVSQEPLEAVSHVLSAGEVERFLRQTGREGLEVEIGCGNGHFLTATAERHPSRSFLGVDLKMPRCRKALRKAERRGLANVGIVCARGEEVLRHLPDCGVSTFHLYFPDPWPKSRHRRRRFFKMPQLELLAGKLTRGGKLHFVTDFYDYYVQAKVLVLLHPRMELLGEPPPEDALVSMFGRRFVDWGKDIYCVNARRSR